MRTLHLTVRLLGRFEASANGATIEGLSCGRARELFAYLVLHPGRAHLRQKLAERMFDGGESARKQLRQKLWQLQQSVLAATGDAQGLMRDAGPDWVELSASVELDVDVSRLLRAHERVLHSGGTPWPPELAADVDRAIGAYRGDFLEGIDSDWCVFEREHLNDIYVRLLEVMTDHCEAEGRFLDGVEYATCALREDRAREALHRRIMWLHARHGDRTSALRQYQRCVDALRDELGVTPSRATRELYMRIRVDRQDDSDLGPAHLLDMRRRLDELRARLDAEIGMLRRDLSTSD